MPNLPTVTIVITVYNEHSLIEGMVDQVIQAMAPEPVAWKILVVDDGSTDWTLDLERRLLSKKSVRLIRFSPNQGKGAALSRTFPQIDTDYTIFIDADQEYHADDIRLILDPMLQDRADCVLGSRYGFGRKRPPQYLATYLVNQVINLWFWIASGHKFGDILCGLYGVRTSFIHNVTLKESRFSYTGELLWYFIHRKARWDEAPVKYTFRTYGKGKKIKWWETFTLIHAIVKYRFSGPRC